MDIKELKKLINEQVIRSKLDKEVNEGLIEHKELLREQKSKEELPSEIEELLKNPQIVNAIKKKLGL